MADAPSLDALTKAAEGGDPAAQYQLAGALHALARYAEAQAWTERAAAQGYPPALYTDGARYLSGAGRLAGAGPGLAALRRADAAGISAATRLLATAVAWGLDGPPDWSGAVQLLVKAGDAGDPGAMREAGFLLAMASDAPDAAGPLVRRAAERGDPIARAWTARFAAADGTHAPDWAATAARIAAIRPPAFGEGEIVSAAPRARAHRKFWTDWECAYAIQRSEPLAAPSLVFDEAAGEPRLDPHRTAHAVAFWPLLDDLVLHQLNLRIAAAAGMTFRQGELLNVLRYEQGQEYRPHFDFFDAKALSHPRVQADGGQRVRTVLVYLNAGYAGGETHFIPGGVRFKGAAGDALLFDNVDAYGEPDRASLHAGRPVTEGVKWLASKWFRQGAAW